MPSEFWSSTEILYPTICSRSWRLGGPQFNKDLMPSNLQSLTDLSRDKTLLNSDPGQCYWTLGVQMWIGITEWTTLEPEIEPLKMRRCKRELHAIMPSIYLTSTVGSKIIRALDMIRVKNLYLIQFYNINICQFIIFRLCTVFNKHEMIKICGQTREKSQVLSKVLKIFAVDCKLHL